MNEYSEALLECDLEEALADKPAPDLRERALQRQREQDRPAPRLPEQAAAPRGRRPGWRWVAQAAGIAIVLGLIGWLVTRQDASHPVYVAGSLAKVEAVNNSLELSEGWLLLRAGAPDVVVLDHRWNTTIESIEGTAIAGTFYRDGIDLSGTFGLDDHGSVGGREVEKLGLTEQERAMFPRAARKMINTGALSLFLLTGSVVIDGVRVEADAPRPAGLRPSLQWESNPKYEAEDPPTGGPDGDGQRKFEIPDASDLAAIKALIGRAAAIDVRTKGRDEDWTDPVSVTEAAEVASVREALTKNLTARSAVLMASSNAAMTSEFALQLNKTQTMTVTVPGAGSWVSIEFPGWADPVFYDVERALHEALQPTLDSVATGQLPSADDIPGIKALLGKVTRAELRVFGDDYKWGGWLQVAAPKDAEAVRAAFADNLKARSEKIAGYKHLNQFRLELADGRVIKAAIYTFGDLVDLSMPGQAGSAQYDVDTALFKTLQPWLDRAAKVDALPLKDAAAMRALLARARVVAFRDDTDPDKPTAGALAARGPIRALIDALWRNDLGESDAEGGTSRTTIQLTFELPEGEKVAVEICDNGWFAMKIAGAPDLVFRTLPGGALQSIRNVLEPHGKAAAPAPLSVLRSWSGPNSGVKKARAEILTTEEKWKTTWADHDPAAELPKVDFEREMVLAIFDGDSWNSRGFYVHELLAGDNGATTIRVDEHTYQTSGEGNRVTPFGIFVITRTERTVTVEENVQNLIGKPPQWKPLTVRVQMFSDLPTIGDVFAKYKPAQTWTGAATRTEALFMTATNDTEWRDMWDKMIIADPQLPVIDWTKQMAVAMRGEIMQGLGDFRVQYAGANANRTVLRLITPTAQTAGGAPVYEPRYAIWVIPRPAKSLVVETPRYGRLDQPPSWLEEHVVTLK